jgi:dUTP pyrophosphatase
MQPTDSPPTVAVGIINRSTNPLPAYQTPCAAGLDICAFVQSPIVLMPFQRMLIPTGLYLEIPTGFEVQLRPRSGLALRYGITLLNSPATIDADYRGEIQVLLINLGNEPFEITNGMRICQMVLQPVYCVQWQIQTVLTQTMRGVNGFGHTGQ